MEFKSGFAAIVGLPNAGKSTFLNGILGQKLSITSDKPQTTRKRILGILTEEKYQLIFLDTPGILEPNYLLQKKMLEHVNNSIKDADVLVFILDVQQDPDAKKFFDNILISEALLKSKKPKLLLINKIDVSDQKKLTALMALLEEKKQFYAIIPISAQEKFNLISAVNSILEKIPEGPLYYPPDIVADENERFFVSEIIREKIFNNFQDEIPYSSEVLIDEFIEKDGRKDVIYASIIVEKETQKGILIGNKGEAIKKIGQEAREDIEKFLDREVFLDLKVKVVPKWRTDERKLKHFGYSNDTE